MADLKQKEGSCSGYDGPVAIKLCGYKALWPHQPCCCHDDVIGHYIGISPVRQTQVSTITSEANRSTNGFIRVGPFMTTQICLVPKTSNIGCACYVRHRYVADRLANVINLIGDPILGVQKTGSETGSARNSSRLCILCHKSRSFLLVGLCHAIRTSLYTVPDSVLPTQT